MDIFYLDGINYLLVVDYYSKYPEVQPLQEMTTHNVIKELKSIFARNGTPDMIVSDNGPQFTSSDMREFLQQFYR